MQISSPQAPNSFAYTRRFRWYSSPPRPSVSAAKGSSAPHVTVIRPVKGLDPLLYECLESTFLQTYPSSQLTVYFCVADRHDSALPVLQSLLSKYSAFDARLFVESEDPYLQADHGNALGPNPKIRSMSRAYREAKGNIVWIVDCNVWVNKGTCGRMVDRLCGYGGKRPNKFVHQLPIVVDVGGTPGRPRSEHSKKTWATIGGRFEEAWLSAAHAKFYTAINTVLIAPCIVGKSNMLRKSHLDALTDGQGIDFFSHNICEDHLIGDLLWRREIPLEIVRAAEENDSSSSRPWGNHALDFGDFAIQPVASMSVSDFFSRRVRWLRVRKWTVIAATMVEPGTECLLCSLYGAFAITTLPFFNERFGIPQTWTAFILAWILGVILWAMVDWNLYCLFHSGSSIEMDNKTPTFAQFRQRRQFGSWLSAWIGRELLAFPIWVWAVYGGMTVTWRGKKFRVSMDMKVREIEQDNSSPTISRKEK
jgi:ceramide glucosyltransferase